MNAKLKRLLDEARKRGPMTEAELAAQRRSYVLAEAAFGSDADEAAYRRAILAEDDAEIDRLKAESDARVAFAKRVWDEETSQ